MRSWMGCNSNFFLWTFLVISLGLYLCIMATIKSLSKLWGHREWIDADSDTSSFLHVLSYNYFWSVPVALNQPEITFPSIIVSWCYSLVLSHYVQTSSSVHYSLIAYLLIGEFLFLYSWCTISTCSLGWPYFVPTDWCIWIKLLCSCSINRSWLGLSYFCWGFGN